MTVVYNVTPELRDKFKEPFGILIKGSFAKTMDKMKALIEQEKPPRIISVGDIVSANLYEHNILPQTTIIDNKSMRCPITPIKVTAEKTIHVNNPQGTITKEAIFAIKEATKRDEYVHIIVNGEEDLLALIAVLYAPKNTLIVYGQPCEGIVVVKVTSQKKAEAQNFLKAMKSLEKLNKKKTV
jgi:GTP-dependent dephospho-CoA kinase